MYSYTGSKSKLVNLYPAPTHNLIIEPLAGSARYALKYWEREVELWDLSDYVVEVWKYLIAASRNDILSLPADIPSKININDLYPSLYPAERYLIGFSLCRGKSIPRKTGHGLNSWAKDRIRISNLVHRVKHWTITKGSYIDIPNKPATWYIDPPYQQTQKQSKDKYLHWKIDYENLAEWIKERNGQVIACEGAGADYLPFEFLKSATTMTNNKTAKVASEYVYLINR